jgi:hypothetical protein
MEDEELRMRIKNEELRKFRIKNSEPGITRNEE